MIERLLWAMIPVSCLIASIWLNRREKREAFKGFNDWGRRIDRVIIILFLVGIASTLSVWAGWKFHLNYVLESVLFWISMYSFGMTLFLLLRYIGMPSDEDVEKIFPGWMQLVHKRSLNG